MGTALVVLVLLLLLLGGGGLVWNVLWYALVIALAVWLLGFIVRAVDGGGRWYRW